MRLALCCHCHWPNKPCSKCEACFDSLVLPPPLPADPHSPAPRAECLLSMQLCGVARWDASGQLDPAAKLQERATSSPFPSQGFPKHTKPTLTHVVSLLPPFARFSHQSRAWLLDRGWRKICALLSQVKALSSLLKDAEMSERAVHDQNGITGLPLFLPPSYLRG